MLLLNSSNYDPTRMEVVWSGEYILGVTFDDMKREHPGCSKEIKGFFRRFIRGGGPYEPFRGNEVSRLTVSKYTKAGFLFSSFRYVYNKKTDKGIRLRDTGIR